MIMVWLLIIIGSYNNNMVNIGIVITESTVVKRIHQSSSRLE